MKNNDMCVSVGLCVRQNEKNYAEIKKVHIKERQRGLWGEV